MVSSRQRRNPNTRSIVCSARLDQSVIVSLSTRHQSEHAESTSLISVTTASNNFQPGRLHAAHLTNARHTQDDWSTLVSHTAGHILATNAPHVSVTATQHTNLYLIEQLYAPSMDTERPRWHRHTDLVCSICGVQVHPSAVCATEKSAEECQIPSIIRCSKHMPAGTTIQSAA